MFQFLTKLFIYRQIYNFIKERIAGISFTAILIFLIIYIHSEYLNYVEFKSKNDESYIGASFIIKNAFIILILIGYFYFYRTINKTKESFKDTKEIIKNEQGNSNDKVKSLDEFLEDDELNR